ncbi:hypothetical protein SAMN05444340_10185 [Citreimonas salinaria]|uniref:Uncharacterized protein n=1 Tax=Citreimonas salinaria TaxID=321339 RepID=A0A1H3EZ21_9RHOB|nr:hypothetical protein SAMN05444340_10185 [Citreimonas salinaria]
MERLCPLTTGKIGANEGIDNAGRACRQNGYSRWFRTKEERFDGDDIHA